MRPDDRIRVLHMMEAIEAAVDFIDGRNRGDLDNDRQLLFAIVRAIEIAGEAAARISPESRALAPDVPWQSIVSMRNRLIHGYFDIDRSIVWKTAREELPPLLRPYGPCSGKAEAGDRRGPPTHTSSSLSSRYALALVVS